jgi:hypothetical protein
MPNWLTTRCKVSGSKEDVAAFLAAAFTEENGNKRFDFNKIIPMPDAIVESAERASDHRSFYDEKAAALLLLALNDTHGIVRASERPSDPNSGSDKSPATSSDALLSYLLTGAKPALSHLVESRDEVALFLAGVDKSTGVSTHPLSPHATMAALQTVAPGFSSSATGLSNYVAKISRINLDGEAMWSEQDVSREGPASLERLAKKMMRLPNAKEVLDSGIFQLRAFAETGYESWYDWSLVNWSTKWNADSANIISQSDTDIDFLIDTAWSFPKPIFKRLGEMFPQMKIWCACIEEGCGVFGWGYFTEIRGEEPGEEFYYYDDADEAHLLVFDEERPKDEEEGSEYDEDGSEHSPNP